MGKAPGGFQLSTDALQAEYEKPVRQFDEKLEELTHFVRDDFPDTHRYAALRPRPQVDRQPGIFLLGGSTESAISAAKLGISFVFAYFINGEEEVLKEARRAFDAHLPQDLRLNFILLPLFLRHIQKKKRKNILCRVNR